MKFSLITTAVEGDVDVSIWDAVTTNTRSFTPPEVTGCKVHDLRYLVSFLLQFEAPGGIAPS